MSQIIHQTEIFNASPHAVYEALMDEKIHALFTDSEAKISRQVGGSFTAYGDYIRGRIVELVPDRKIVQEWRAVDWEPEQVSMVTFDLNAVQEGTQLVFTHSGLPEGSEDEFAQGWIDNYWEPMRKFFAGQ